MGWKLELGILGALVAAIVIFRKQLSGAFSEAGAAVGESVGGFFGSIPSGIVSGGQKGFTEALPAQFKTPTGEFRPLLGTKEEFEANFLKAFGIQTADAQQPVSNQTVTPQTRDYSDVGIVKSTVQPYTEAQRKSYGAVARVGGISEQIRGFMARGYSQREAREMARTGKNSTSGEFSW